MTTLGKVIILLVVLGLGLPSYGEILVYKIIWTGTYWEQGEGEWAIDRRPSKAYVVFDVDYADNTIVQAEVIRYWTSDNGKEFGHGPLDAELVRVEYEGRVQWLIQFQAILEQDITGSSTHMVAGQARGRSVGAQENREVATALRGYGLQDETHNEYRNLGMWAHSFTLYSTWTHWANGDEEGEGNQDFEATKQMIKGYLTTKGYTEQSE
jgi:hypothetical protein